MLFKIAMPLLMMFGPRLLPPLIKYVVLVWKLIFDRRVSLILRALVPMSILYFLSPWDLVSDKFGPISRIDDLLVFALALLLLIKLSPPYVVNEHLGITPLKDRPQERDPDKVVDGTSRPVDEESGQ